MTAVFFTNIDGAHRFPARELAPKRRTLAAVVREVADFTVPFLVAVLRRKDLAHCLDLAQFERAAFIPPATAFRPQKTWSKTRIGPRDVVTFVHLPAGGNRSSGGQQAKSGLAIGASIAAIALAVIAPYAISFIATGLVGVFGSASTLAATLLYTGAVVGLNYLASSASKSKANKQAEARPLYGAQGGGNTAQPGARIPVIYGRTWTTPILSQPDFVMTEGDGLKLYKRMTIGCGKYNLKKIRVGSAIIWENGSVTSDLAASIQVEMITPGSLSALVPSDIYSSGDVTGIELPRPGGNPEYAGPFRVSPQGKQVSKIQIDISTQGIYAESSVPKFAGIKYPHGSDSQFEYSLIDANGAPTGGWTRIANTAFSGNSAQPQRRTIITPVTPGEYVVRAKNNTPVVPNTESSSNWDGLRGHIGSTAARPGITEIAMVITAGPGLSITSYNNIEVEVARVLPCRRNGSFVEMESSKALDAAFDMARDTRYGRGIPDAKINWTKIEAYLTQLTTFDTFDDQINGPSSLREIMSVILNPMRAEPLFTGQLVSFVRDEPQVVQKHHFTRRQILSGSSGAEYNINRSNSAISVEAEYNVDGDPKRRQEAFAAYGPEQIAPTSIKFQGVKTHEHAVHLCRWTAAYNYYRFKKRTFDLELNHRLILPGDVVGVDSWFLSGGLAGGVEAAAGDVLTCDFDLDWPGAVPTTPYAVILDKQGREFGPIAVTIADRLLYLYTPDRQAAEIATGKTLAQVLGSDIDESPAVVRLGSLTEVTERWIVQSVQPKSIEVATVTVVNDSSSVWSAIGAAIPPGPTIPSVVGIPTVPSVAWVRGTLSQDAGAIRLAWACSNTLGTETYEIEASYDNGTSYSTIARTPQPSGTATVSVTTQLLVPLRARAIGSAGIPGPWVYGSTPSRQVEPVVVGVTQILDDLRTAIAAANATKAVALDRVNVAAAAASDVAALYLTKIEELTRELEVTNAQFREKIEVGSSATTALAKRTTEFEATVGTATAKLSEIEIAYVSADAALAQRITTTEAATAANAASISNVQTAYTAADIAITNQVNTNQATNAAAFSSINTTLTNLVTADTAFAAFQTKISARFDDSRTANVDTVINTLGTGNLTAAQQLTGVTATNGLLLATGALEFYSVSDGITAASLIYLYVKTGSGLLPTGLYIRSITNAAGTAGEIVLQADKTRFVSPSTGARMELNLIGGSLTLYNASGVKAIELSVN